MALGVWLDFTGNNPVVNTIYIMAVISLSVMGMVQLVQLDEN